MAFSRAALAAAAVVVLVAPEPACAFSVGPGVGSVRNLRSATRRGTTLPPKRTGESSPTSLSSSYVVKPEMARCRATQWRKLRTRGPGFGEKVRRSKADPDLSQKLSDGLSYLNADEMEEVQQALAMSIYAHSVNSRRAGSGYKAVKTGVEACLILGELQVGTDALLAAILSGVLRPRAQSKEFGQAAVTVADIEEGFGARVARSVENFDHVMRLEEMARRRMSRRAAEDVDDEADLDTGKKQRHYLRELIISEASDWQVLTLYLAVHMQKLRSAIAGRANNATRLARDALEIHAPLAHRLGVHHLSGGLEDLAFEALYPTEYEEIRRATEARMSVYQEVMETAKSAVSAALRKDKTFMSELAGEVVLQHRIKEPYSMWKKMTRQGGGVDGVYDAVALRAVLKAKRLPGETEEDHEERSKQLCYHAMSVAKKMYPSVEGRCKDYVMRPKPNGYQSLHSTHEVSVSPAAAASAGGERRTHFELQVRSASMHHKAEYGHAAHWSYKSDDGGAKAGGVGERRSWRSYDRLKAAGARRTGIDSPATAVPDSVSSGKELVTWLHLELRQRKVFVFGPDNLIWELDKASATAENVLGRSHAAGIRLIDGGAAGGKKGITLVNGKAVPRHYAFKNGDVLDLDLAMA
ncbi:unnamed protein product [Ectocarpus sp. CCAP 1310/34]|nr:unnamed protein product [Ectocarpus sp. CCAP 1310/34]